MEKTGKTLVLDKIENPAGFRFSPRIAERRRTRKRERRNPNPESVKARRGETVAVAERVVP